MMKKPLYTILMILLFAATIDITLAGPIHPITKCKTCGKPLSLCSGHETLKPKKGKNQTRETRPSQKTSDKRCKICGKSISLCGGNHSTSKVKSVSKAEMKDVNQFKVEQEQVYKSVEQMPQFPGGEAALMKYLSSHINYPPVAAENNIQGRVIVQFVVDKTGKVGEVKVIRSVEKDLDKEAVRLCKSLPKFTPGRHNGQAVSVWYTLPVNFKLTGTSALNK